MADITHRQFVDLLRRSNVVAPKKLNDWLQRTGNLGSARKLAKSLVEEGMLTTWQAKFLLSGRHRLAISNYHLLTRLRRDEFGARYLAVHASLARKVELQIFSKDLTSDTQRWQEMIQKATLVANLDHAGLVHVYDIDHDDERYFLVVEHVTGRALDIDNEIFTPQQIGDLILTCIQSIEYAHQNGVVHGTIGPQDILVTDKGTAKIQNLTVSPLRNLNLQTAPAQPVDDYHALASVGRRLIWACPGSQAGVGETLEQVFSTLSMDVPAGLEALKRWVQQNSPPKNSDQVTASGAFPILSNNLHQPASGREGDTSSKFEPDNLFDAESLSSSRSFASSPSFATSVSIIRTAKNNRAFMVASAIALMLLGGIVVFGAMRVYHKLTRPLGSIAKPAGIDSTPTSPANKQTTTGDSVATDKPHGQRTTVARPKIAVSVPADDSPNTDTTTLTTPARDNDQTSPTPEKNILSQTEINTLVDSNYSDILGIRDGQPIQSTPELAATTVSIDRISTESAARPITIPNAEKQTPDSLSLIKGVGEATESAFNQVGIRTFGQLAQMSPTDLVAALKDNGSSINLNEAKAKNFIDQSRALAINPSADPDSIDPDDHFALVSPVLNLPPVHSTAPVQLTSLVIPSIYELSANLICPDGIAPKRIFFDLERDQQDSQTWVFGLKRKRSASNAQPIATLQQTADALIFYWLPAANKEKLSTYLRNCFLRLSTPDGRSKVLILRQPIKTRSLRIAKGRLVDELRLDIAALPKDANLSVNLLAVPRGKPELEMVRSEVSAKLPAIIGLRQQEKPEDRFMTLQVAARLQAKSITLTGGLVMTCPSGSALIKDMDHLALIRNQLAANRNSLEIQVAQQRYDAALSNQKKIAKRKDARMDVYLETIDRIVAGDGGIGEPIDFEIAAEFDAGKIVFVRSNKNFVPDDSFQNSKK